MFLIFFGTKSKIKLGVPGAMFRPLHPLAIPTQLWPSRLKNSDAEFWRSILRLNLHFFVHNGMNSVADYDQVWVGVGCRCHRCRCRRCRCRRCHRCCRCRRYRQHRRRRFSIVCLLAKRSPIGLIFGYVTLLTKLDTK